jgi:hypothetical protein
MLGEGTEGVGFEGPATFQNALLEAFFCFRNPYGPVMRRGTGATDTDK